MMMKRFNILTFISVLLLLIIQKTAAMQKAEENDDITRVSHSNVTLTKKELPEEESTNLCHPTHNNDEIDDHSIPSLLTVTTLSSICPGIYESDDIELILSHPLKQFEKQDLIIFDVDQVLIAILDPYYFEHFTKKSPLHNRLFSQDKSIIEMFFLYMFVAHPCRIMDERIPSLIERLQTRKINCIANTAIHPTIKPSLNIDAPSLRIKTLRNYNINFSGAFPELQLWNFDTLEAKHIIKDTPLFKEGVIFSSETPKPVTTLELFKKLGIKPKRVAYIDDIPDNSHKMYEALNSQGIECYSFVYSKKKTTSLQRGYYPNDLFNQELQKIEFFLEKLLNGEVVDAFFTELKDSK